MILVIRHMRLICSRRLRIPGDVFVHDYVDIGPRAVFTGFVRSSEAEGIPPNRHQNEH